MHPYYCEKHDQCQAEVIEGCNGCLFWRLERAEHTLKTIRFLLQDLPQPRMYNNSVGGEFKAYPPMEVDDWIEMVTVAVEGKKKGV